MNTKKPINKNYVFLDYDGFICKAWYAHISRNAESASPMELLQLLENSAIEKARDCLDGEIVVIKFISGHSWKKTLYESYKANRRKDPYIGAMRDYVKANDKNVIKLTSLEADEIIGMLASYLKILQKDSGYHTIIFSDDKDLHRISEYYCKVNFEEDVTKNESNRLYYEQFLAGDKEDNVTGIPKVGYKKAKKLLADNGYNLDGVIKTYKGMNIDREECAKNLILIDPMLIEHNTESNYMNDFCKFFLAHPDEELVNQASSCLQVGLIKYMEREVERIYGEG